MAITYISGTEAIIAANYPFGGYTDTKNRAGQYIDNQLTQEHTSDYRHVRTARLAGEIGSYTGNATARTISLSNSNLLPKAIEVWAQNESGVAQPVIRLSNMTSTNATTRVDNSWWTNFITGEAVGEFSLDSSDVVNDSGTTFYYYVLGVDQTTSFTGDAGAGSEPTYVQDGDELYGDGTGSSPANQVESHIETAFLHEHLDSGVHNPHPFTNYGKIENITWTGNGAQQDISLSESTLDIKELLILKGNVSGGGYTAFESMTANNTKIEDTIAYGSNYIISIGTGTFTVHANLNVNSRDLYALVVGA